MTQTRKKQPKNWRFILLLLSALAIPSLSNVIKESMPQFKNLELLAYDRHCWDLLHSRPIKPDPRLVLIGMDDGSLERLLRHAEIDRLAYNRRLQGRLAHILHAAGARVIGYDVWFTDPAPR